MANEDWRDKNWRPESELRKEAEAMVGIIYDPEATCQEVNLAIVTLVELVAPGLLEEAMPDAPSSSNE